MQGSCFQVFLCSCEVKKPSLKGFHLTPQQELEFKKKKIIKRERDHKSFKKTVTVRISAPSQLSCFTLLADFTEVSLIDRRLKSVSKNKW